MTTFLLSTLLIPAAAPAEEFLAGVQASQDQAKARQHFRAAAAGFDLVWLNGDHSAQTATDRGRSHFLAGNLPMAVVAFLAGVRETPSDVDLLHGLATCRAAVLYPVPTQPDEQLRPDPLRGWRHRLSEWDVFRAVVLASALVVVGLARRFTVRDVWAVPVAILGGVGLLVCGLLLLQFDAEQAAEEEKPRLVVAVESPLRKGNGLTHERRINSMIPRGAEVRERTRRGGWIQVELPGGAVGWLPETCVLPVE